MPTPISPADLPLHWVTTMRPSSITPEMLGAAPDARIPQMRILGRAKNRAEFARMIIAAGLDRRSPAAVTTWLRNYGATSRNAEDLAVTAAGGLFVRSENPSSRAPLAPFPMQP